MPLGQHHQMSLPLEAPEISQTRGEVRTSLLREGGASDGAIFEGADSDFFVFVFFFFLFRGSREDSTLTSSTGNGAGIAIGLDGVALFEEKAAFFLFEAPEEVDFFGEGALLLLAAAEDALTLDLVFFEAGT